jgi:ribose 5-phosphate isomerase B
LLTGAVRHTAPMRVHIGADHGAYDLKVHLQHRLAELGHEVVDHGPFRFDPEDDYPVFCLRAAAAVAAEPESLGVVLGGSGNGEQMAANKVEGVRAALAWNEKVARLARQHNDANVVSVGGRMHSVEEATAIVEAFLAEPFGNDERHSRRIAMLTSYEQGGGLPAFPDED